MAGRSITDNLKEGAAARQAHYRWAAIPAEILKRWTAERGRRTKTSRKRVAGRRALHYRWFGSLGMSAYLRQPARAFSYPCCRRTTVRARAETRCRWSLP